MHMPASVIQTIETFANNMDIHAEEAPDGSYTFIFERSGTFSLTPSLDKTRIHVSLMRHPFRADSNAERRLFEQAGLDPLTNIFLHVGLTSEGEFVCIINIDTDRFDLPNLDYAFQRLSDALDNAA